MSKLNREYNQLTITIRDVNVSLSNGTPVVTMGELSVTSQTNPKHAAKALESLTTLFLPMLAREGL